MNIAYEFSKVKESFQKVKNDIFLLTSKINENYDVFLREHRNLVGEVEGLSNGVKEHITKFKEEFNSGVRKLEDIPEQEILNIKSEMNALKKQIGSVLMEHNHLHSLINDVKKNEKDIKNLKKELKSSELEIYLLKERLIEKDTEVKQMKDISSHLLDVVGELSAMELEILNKIK